MHKFRHYIYGIPKTGEEFFITTTLSVNDAVEFAKKHREVFRDRFVSYSIRQTDVEVETV